MRRAFLFLLCGMLVPAASRARAQVSPASAEKYAEGVKLVESRRFHDALKVFEEALRLDPNNARAHRGLGRVYRETKHYEKARVAYQSAIGVKPDYAVAHYELGKLQYQFLKDYEGAQRSFREVLKLDPGTDGGKAAKHLKASYVKHGEALFRQHNYQEAVARFRSASQVDPSDATPFYNLGLAYYHLRDYVPAEEAFTTATDLDPAYAKAFKLLGDVYRKTGAHTRAIESYSKAVEIDEGYVEARLNLAAVYSDTEQPQKATGVLEEAAGLFPDNHKVHASLGYAYAQQNDLTNALASYLKALALKGTDPEVNYRVAVVYHKTGRFQEAITRAQKAMNTKFGVPAHVVLGDVYSDMKPDGWKELALQHYGRGLQDRRFQKYCEDRIHRIAGEDTDAAPDETE